MAIVPPDFAAEFYRALDMAPPFALVTVVAQALGETLDAKDVELWLSDYGEKALVRVDGTASLPSRYVPLDDPSIGKCFRSQAAVVESDGQCSLLLPITVRSERLGVMQVVLPEEPEDYARRVLAEVATALGYVLVNARRYTDLFERTRRRRSLGLAAELQWELLPVLSYDGAEFTLAGVLEPAYDVAGDNFDYCVDTGRLDMSVSDGMGHGLRAAMVTSLVVTATRNARRSGMSLLEQIDYANEVVCEQFSESDHFATRLSLSFDLQTGEGIAVNAGHQPAWLHRRDRVEPILLDPDLPLGLFPHEQYRLQEFHLEPGDRLVLPSDGVLEAARRRNDPFGAKRFTDILIEHRHEPPHDFVRRVIRDVLAHCEGELLDDATLLCLDWRGRRS